MNVDEIRRIAEIMQKYELTEFSIESEDCKMKVRRGSKQNDPVASPHLFASPYSMPPAASPVNVEGSAGSAAPTARQSDQTAEPVDEPLTIDSPIVGTFYTTPTPDAEAFVKVGDEVSPDTVVCIIEAMKVMNEIKAEKSGRIKKVLAQHAQPVEFGQPLFELE